MKGLLVLLLLFSASVAYADIYTWKDSRGTEHYTNSLDEIPARYLKKARVLDVATGKKGRLATAQPPAQSAPAAAPGQSAAPSPPPPEVVSAPPPPVPAPPPVAANPAPPVPPAATYQPPTRHKRAARQPRTNGANEE